MNFSTFPLRTSLLQELDRSFDEFLGGVGSSRSRWPRVTVRELEGGYEAEFDVPGVAMEDLHLTVQDGELVLEGRRTLPDTGENSGHVNERSAGDFRRSLRLGRDVELSGVEAELEDGVLRILLPKVAEHRPRRISIQSQRGNAAESGVADGREDGE